MDVLGQAATVAQLAGVDAGGLITMIIQAVQTVQRNKEECRQLMHHVMIISDLLQLLQQSETMRHPEITVPLDGLADTLRQAYMLVTSCQQSNIMYRFFAAANQAQKFRDVRDRIDSYLRIYPLISHIDTRYFLSRLHGPAHPSGALEPQASDEVVESFRSVPSPNFRTEGSAFNDNDNTEPVEDGAVTNSFGGEGQGDGYANAEVLPNKWYRFTWLVRRTQRETSTIQWIHGLIDHDGKGGFTIFKLSQLAASTNNFSSNHMIGRGGYGDVYQGKLPNGVHVAIKVRSTSKSFAADMFDEFENEVRIMSKLQHANIVRLLGCCIEGHHRTLVYEYVPGGSLDYILHELRSGISLVWPMRFRIIEGIVQGAVYLHHHSRLRVVHVDLKASNILLDCDMTPLICDFGISQVMHSDEDVEVCARGTWGYIEPEYCHTGFLSTKSDVYGFGVTFLEIISAQRALISLPGEGIQWLVEYAWGLWSSGRAMELVDPSLRDDSQISEILRCLQIALLCVQRNRVDRPTMSDVLMMLKCASMTLPDPRPPQDLPVAAGSTSTSYTTAECTTEEIEESSLPELEDVNSDRPVTFD